MSLAEKPIPGSHMKLIKTSPEVDDAAKSVCIIKFPDGNSGTGFLAEFTLNGKQVHGLFTNNHVLNQQLITPSHAPPGTLRFTLEFHLFFDRPRGDRNRDQKVVSIDINNASFTELFGIGFTCQKLDATFIQFNDKMVEQIKTKTPTNLNVGYLPLVKKDDYKKMDQVRSRVKVIGHPVEECDHPGEKHIAEGDIYKIKGYNLLHEASTTPGSSGSPLLLHDSDQVVGIHKTAGVGNYNVAVAIVDVCTAIEKSMKPGSRVISSLDLRRELQKLGFKSRHPHCRGTVYSHIQDNKEVWYSHTSHGFYYTESDPAEFESYYDKDKLEAILTPPTSEMKDEGDCSNLHDKLLAECLDHMYDLLAWMPLHVDVMIDTDLVAQLKKL